MKLEQKRQKQWLKGKTVQPRERIKCGCCGFPADKEFDFGFFCEDCFMAAKTCDTPWCENPVQRERIHAGVESCSKYCRTCMFEYAPEPFLLNSSPMAEAQKYAPGKQSIGLLNDLNRAMEKHGITNPNPRKNWFYPPKEINND